MKTLFTFICFLIFLTGNSQNHKPKLVVGIIVDQMRQEYLWRFYDKFGDDGFKRLINGGFSFSNAHINYTPTITAPGHTSVYTGTTPRYHGIIANDWYNRKTGLSTYCASDPDVEGLGSNSFSGKMSPKNLLSSTLGDELKISTNFKAKVVGVSIKDRGSILAVGHLADAAYWYESRNGEFISSTYYLNKLPQWVVDFNKQKVVDNYLNNTWNTLLPIENYTESLPDNNEYEQLIKGKDTPTFPYDLSELRKKDPYGLISKTPFGNNLILDMSKAAIAGEKMGNDDITDLLCINLSSTDYVGHRFGPISVELEDTYLRLDRTLGEFIDFLDEKIGKNEYLIFIAADHAVAYNPVFLTDHKMPGGNFQLKNMKDSLKTALEEKFGEGNWIENISNWQIYLNHQLIEKSEWNKKDFTDFLVPRIYAFEGVSEVYLREEIKNATSHDFLGSKISNGYNWQRSGDIVYNLNPGYLYDEGNVQGTTHGTGYTYDSHIPLIFYGNGIKKGSSSRSIAVTDIAPTLSTLLKITLPNACTGQPILEISD